MFQFWDSVPSNTDIIYSRLICSYGHKCMVLHIEGCDHICATWQRNAYNQLKRIVSVWRAKPTLAHVTVKCRDSRPANNSQWLCSVTSMLPLGISSFFLSATHLQPSPFFGAWFNQCNLCCRCCLLCSPPQVVFPASLPGLIYKAKYNLQRWEGLIIKVFFCCSDFQWNVIFNIKYVGLLF